MNHTDKKKYSGIGLLILAYVAFISLGLPDALFGVAWPSIRKTFSLTLDSVGPLLVAGTAGYLTSSFFSGRVTARLGVGMVLVISCALTGLVLIGYTIIPSWWMMVALGTFAGLGAGSIDAGLNTYMAANFGEGLMQWLHASYGIGTTIGPIIMTTGLAVFSSWRPGYVFVGMAQIILAVCFIFTLPMWQQKPDTSGQENTVPEKKDSPSLLKTFRQPGVLISILLFFLYTGIEATLGLWIYSLLTESRSISPEIAGIWTGGLWATFTAGRIIAGIIAKRIRIHTLIRICLLAAFAGGLLLWLNLFGVTSLPGVIIMGFAIAPIFPGLVSGTEARVTKRYMANTIGIQLSAAGIGVAALPGFAGVLARHISLEIIPVFLITIIIVLSGLYLLSMRLEKRHIQR